MSPILKPLRFVLLLTVGVVAGFGLSLGRTVHAQREIEPAASTRACGGEEI